MKRILTLVIITIHCSLFTIPCEAQLKKQKRIDSLEDALKKFDADKKELGTRAPKMFDTTEAMILFQLGRAIRGNDAEKAVDYARQCLEISERLGFKKGIAKAYGLLGGIEYSKGNYDTAISLYQRDLEIEKETGDKSSAAANYLSLGNVYYVKGDFPQTLVYYYDALKIREEIGELNLATNIYVNIGMVYLEEENLSEAMRIFNKGVDVQKKAGNKDGIAVLTGWVSRVYDKMGDSIMAKKKMEEASKIFEEIDDKSNIAGSYDGIGSDFLKAKMYDSALFYYLKEYQIYEGLKMKNLMAGAKEQIGNVYVEQSRFDDDKGQDSFHGCNYFC